MSSTGSVSELLLRWEELRQQGRMVSPEELCRNHPDLVDDVRREIQVLEAMYRVPNGLDQAVTDAADMASAGRLACEPELPAVAAYEVLEKLGQGGMGVVYKARHRQLKRLVALKMVLARAHATAGEVARFRREAEAVARLQHPHIVQIYEVGEQEGCPYLALEYVDGGNLSEKLYGNPLPVQLAAQLVETVARAVHAAHDRGIVHRDLKPSNVLLTADGTPKIADFGLAKYLESGSESPAAAGATQTGSILGSPSYMAPEQAAGKIREIGPATDVYALGAILYELLTGRPPFRGPTLLETLEQVRSEEVVAPHLFRPALPPDLETVCLKCLRKEPAQRYASAQDLADDLGRFLKGDLVHARSFGLVDRLRHLLGRGGHDVRFQSWARLLMFLTPVPTVMTALPLWCVRQGWLPPACVVLLPLTTLVTMLFLLYWRGRPRRHLTTGSVERQFWSVWVADVSAITLVAVVSYLMSSPERPWDAVSVFPFWSLVTGATFFGMGGSIWGGCYLVGLSFFALALIMPLNPELSPVAFGLLCSVTSGCLSYRLFRLSREEKG
jgi:serine/threonine-protein kinase